MNKLTFDTLTKYQKDMLKVRAHSIYLDKKTNDAPMSVVEATFEIINGMGYDIVKSDRENNVVKNVKSAENPKDDSGYWSKK